MHLHESYYVITFLEIENIAFRKMTPRIGFVLTREILQLIVLKRRKDVGKTETAEMTGLARWMTFALPM